MRTRTREWRSPALVRRGLVEGLHGRVTTRNLWAAHEAPQRNSRREDRDARDAGEQKARIPALPDARVEPEPPHSPPAPRQRHDQEPRLELAAETAEQRPGT